MQFGKYKKGERHPTSKLGSEEILAIRREYDSGKRGKDRGAKWGISANHFNMIGRRQSWRHLAEENGEGGAIDDSKRNK